MRKGSSLLRANDFARFVVRLGDSGWKSPNARNHPVCARLSPVAQRVFWILDLLANRFKQLADSRPACVVRDKRRDKSACVRVNGVGCACFGRAIGLEQPCAIANLYSDNPFLFSGSQIVGRFPLIEISKSVWTGPRLFPNAQSIIAVLSNLRRQPLISNN